MAAAAEVFEKEKLSEIYNQHSVNYEQASTLDIVASINMLRRDIADHGTILSETLDRVKDEELSYIAEGIDRHSHTSFTLRHHNEKGLVFFDKGEWRPYLGTLVTGLKVAEKEAESDYRKSFLVEMAAEDLETGYKMQKLEPGQSMVWYSAFPEQAHGQYGSDFMIDLGFQPKRRMGFIYKATKNEDGSVTLDSHTVDNSDEEAFAGAMQSAENDSGADIETLVRAYDGRMFLKYGKEFRAGRSSDDALTEENAWDFVNRHEPLFNYYFSEIIKLAYSDLSGKALRRAKERLTYGVWARTKELLEEEDLGLRTSYANDVSFYEQEQQIARDVENAHRNAAARGDIMTGCGGSLRGESDESDPDKVFAAIFGERKKDDSDSYTFNKKMFCVVCQAPPKKDENKKDCGPCGICKGCDASIRRATSWQAATAAWN